MTDLCIAANQNIMHQIALLKCCTSRFTYLISSSVNVPWRWKSGDF